MSKTEPMYIREENVYYGKPDKLLNIYEKAAKAERYYLHHFQFHLFNSSYEVQYGLRPA